MRIFQAIPYRGTRCAIERDRREKRRSECARLLRGWECVIIGAGKVPSSNDTLLTFSRILRDDPENLILFLHLF